MQTLPIWQTAMDALDAFWARRRLAVRFGLVPLALGIVVAWALLVLGVDRDEPSAALFAAAAIDMIIYLPPTVAWYLTLVHGEAQTARRPMFTLGAREARLLLWQLLLAALLVAGLAVGALAIAGVGYLIRAAFGNIAAAVAVIPLAIATGAAFFVVGNRLAMTLVLASVGAPVRFRTAWDLTRGIAWRFAGALIVIVLAVLLLLAALELAAWLIGVSIALVWGAPLADVLPYPRAAAQAAAGLTGLFTAATLFGLVYRIRAPHPGAATEAAVAPIASEARRANPS